MKKILILILILFFTISAINAANISDITDNDDYGETIQASIQDHYLINNTKQLQSTFSVKKDKKHTLHSYIDYRNIEAEADSGGYIDETGEYLLPCDLGLGKHNICFIIEDENGNYISKTSYQFNILKDENDNPAIYEGYTPYYYNEEIEDNMIEEDYNAFQELYGNSAIQPLFVSVQPQITLQNVIKQNEQELLPVVHVNLGIINGIDNSLTSQEITLDL